MSFSDCLALIPAKEDDTHPIGEVWVYEDKEASYHAVLRTEIGGFSKKKKHAVLAYCVNAMMAQVIVDSLKG